MIKKTLLIIILFLIIGLFVNGVRTFFFSSQYNESREIDNIMDDNRAKTAGNGVSELPKIKETASIFEGFKNFIMNPTNKSQNKQAAPEEGEPRPEDSGWEKVQPDNYGDHIQDYFDKTATIIFPTNESLQEAISSYLANDDPEPLEAVIKGFKRANAELYDVNTPSEIQNIQNNSIWITNKLIEVLESIIDADSKEEIIEIINGSDLNEIKEKTLETRTEIQLLKTQYNLDIIL